MKKDDDLIREILDFWFSERLRPLWFRATPELDAEIRERFEEAWGLARAGVYDYWEEDPEGALALVILLDQFPLNMFRGDARSWSTEARAREVAEAAIERGFDRAMPDEQKVFLYMPFMHSENLEDQKRAIELFAAAGLEDNLRYASHHHDIIERFGRFPHRNAGLGRDSTEEEREYLKKARWT